MEGLIPRRVRFVLEHLPSMMFEKLLHEMEVLEVAGILEGLDIDCLYS